MATLVVLLALVAVATAGVVVPNRPYAAHPGPAYGKDYRYDGYGAGYGADYGAGYGAAYPAKGYGYAPVKAVTKNAYDYPSYGKLDYGYKPAAYPVNNYDNYQYRPAVAVPVKKVVDPYPYYSDYRGNAPYAYQPVKKVVDPFPAKAILPAKSGFSAFPSKPAVRKALDPYPYDFGSKSVFPAAKKVADPYPYSYQPNYAVKKVVDPYPNSGFYPAQKVVDPYAYPVKKVAADPYYPSKSAYPVKKVADRYPYDPYYAYGGAKRAIPAKTVAVPVVKKAVVPAKSQSVFGSFAGFGDFGKGFGKDLFPNFKF